MQNPPHPGGGRWPSGWGFPLRRFSTSWQAEAANHHRWRCECRGCSGELPIAGSAVVGIFGGYASGRQSASIKSISGCIQSSNAISFSIRTLSFFGLRPTAPTSSRYRAVLHDADKNEQKGERDEQDAPVLGEVDVVTGGKQSNQANNAADYGFQQDGAEPRLQQTTF